MFFLWAVEAICAQLQEHWTLPKGWCAGLRLLMPVENICSYWQKKIRKCLQQPFKQRVLKNMDDWSKVKLQKAGPQPVGENHVIWGELKTEHTITNQVFTQKYLTMCDNTAPYTAQEVHLVTTEFKIVIIYSRIYHCSYSGTVLLKNRV